jgi:two-component system, chemotaxis family, CheB/CheR fusion protein
MASINDEKQAWSFHVAGIGASAGGIHALRSFVLSLPEKLGLSLVVVQHQMPQQRSTLVQLLGKHSALPIVQALEGMPVQVDHVYIASPDSAVTVEEGVLRTRPFTDQVRPGINTVDTLFASLARDCGPKAIGIVLSGTGSDGAKGVVQIKQAGGMNFAQDPTTSMHNGMPCAAIFTGVVDHVCPIEALAHELLVCTSGSDVLAQTSERWNKEAGKALEEILAIVYRYAEFDLSGYKVTPLLWRIQHRMRVRKVKQFSDYRDLLQDDTAEVESLISGVPIHVTAFFRDAEAWNVLRDKVIEPLVSERNSKEPIRVWTPACSTGEEAYSVAMLLCEANGNHEDTNFQLFATDALPEIVGRASRGQFSRHAVEALDFDRQANFFYPVDGAYRIKRSLREKIVFAPQRLLSDPPFAGVDLITCRNLLIYLEEEAQQRLLALLHSSLRTGGYLFLGDGEALSSKQEGFEVVSSKWHIYRKVGSANGFKVDFPSEVKAAKNEQTLQSLVAGFAHQAIVERLDLPSVLMDADFNILRVYGNTSGILQMPHGEPTHNLLRVARPTLLPHLESTVCKALAERRTVTFHQCSEADPGDSVNIRVTPLQNGESGKNGRLLVSFILGGPLDEPTGETSNSFDESIHPPSDSLRISVEELDASRAELQALNEELRAVNDQLKLSNDEINEINAQLRGKIGELETQGNVLSSGHVMTLFLDEDLMVRWFTPAVAELFPLRTGDTGRRITDLVPKFKDECFLDDVRKVMQDGQLLEAEVLRDDGRWFLRQIRPFRTQAKSTTGAAITFHDITDRKHAQTAMADDLSIITALHNLAERLLLITDLPKAMNEVLAATVSLFRADRGTIQFYDRVADGLRYAAAHGFDVNALALIPPIDRDFHSTCAVALRTGERVVATDILSDPSWGAHASTAESLGYSAAISTPIKTGREELLGIVTVHFDKPRTPTDRELRWADLYARLAAHTIERTRAEAALRENQEKYAALFLASPAPLLILKPDAPHFTITEVNDAYLNATMTKRADLVGKGLFEIFPDNPDEVGATGVRNLSVSLQRVLATRRADVMAVQKYDIRRPQAEGGGFVERWWSPINSPVLGANGEIAAIIHRVEDVTEIIQRRSAGGADQILRDQQNVIERLRQTIDELTREVEKRRNAEDALLKLKAEIE